LLLRELVPLARTHLLRRLLPPLDRTAHDLDRLRIAQLVPQLDLAVADVRQQRREQQRARPVALAPGDVEVRADPLLQRLCHSPRASLSWSGAAAPGCHGRARLPADRVNPAANPSGVRPARADARGPPSAPPRARWSRPGGTPSPRAPPGAPPRPPRPRPARS